MSGRVMAAALAGWAVAATTACMVGPSMERVPVAHGPEGARVKVTTQGIPGEGDAVALSGELLEAREDGLLLRTTTGLDAKGRQAPRPPRLVLVRYTATPGQVRFDQLAPPLMPGRAPDVRALARLRLVSRFPQGLRPELLAALLRDCGQQEVEVWRR